MSDIGSKARLREFLLANVGRIIESKELYVASGKAGQYGRRIRELRDEEGWPISTHNDSTKLKPGQYLLTAQPPAAHLLSFARKISARLRAEVLDRNGFTCQMCGLSPGDADPHTGRKVRLHVGHIVDKSHGGKDELPNLRTLCSTCNQGAKNVTQEKPTKIWLMTQIRRSGLAEQRAAYEWLKSKFDVKDG